MIKESINLCIDEESKQIIFNEILKRKNCPFSFKWKEKDITTLPTDYLVNIYNFIDRKMEDREELYDAYESYPDPMYD